MWASVRAFDLESSVDFRSREDLASSSEAPKERICSFVVGSFLRSDAGIVKSVETVSLISFRVIYEIGK